MKILYFSWIKDGIGKNQEEINLDDNIKTISDLIDFLIKIDQNYEKVFNDISAIRFSKNMNVVNIDENISNDDEIAFFPPMTGG
ncbi:MAG: MoaD/ThiS family protein [Pseudomonadota bacterium]|nr:MoaD/ThiS family protein [Pseudomonadota bacterium]